MNTPHILLIQVRNHGDRMADHERECMLRRMGAGNAHLRVRNALTDDAHPRWLDGVDAVVIGGSGDYSVHHPNSRGLVSRMQKVLDRALSADLPGLGICFGHQLVGQHFGAPVHTDPDLAEVGTIDVELTSTGRADPLFSSAVEPMFHAHTGHSDSVTHVPEGLELLATSSTNEKQAFRVRGTRFYTTQFHPDLTGAEAVARYTAFARTKPEAMPNVARFRPGADAATGLVSRFVEMVTG
jgi:GMP synthase (glutamine-hydrolysing)